MNEWGKCLGYTGTPCPNCGRYRLERYGNGKEVCEKCSWCVQDERYIDRREIYPIYHYMDECDLKGDEE